MDGYELTERGKIVVAVILVLLLLFLPAALLVYTAMADQSTGSSGDVNNNAYVTPPNTAGDPSPPVISESPPPGTNGGGSDSEDPDPTETDPPDVVDPGEPDPTDEPSPEPPPSAGPARVDPVRGTLSFVFSPELHSSLDAETSHMLDDFLTSPRNTFDSTIAVEIPRLSIDVSQRFVNVIADAFAERNIERNRIAYITDPSVPLSDGSFRVNFSYIDRGNK